MKYKIKTSKSPVPVASYSQAIVTENTTKRIFVAGQGPLNVDTNKVDSSVKDQTRQVLLNIKNILNEAGFEMEDIVKVSAFLTDLDNFSEFNEVYEEFFVEPFPVRTTIGCELNDILVEIDVIAEK